MNRLFGVLLSAMFVLSCGALSASQSKAVLDNGIVRLEFSVDGSRVELAEMQKAGGRRWIAGERAASICTLTLQTMESGSVELKKLDTAQASDVRLRRDGDLLNIAWRGIKPEGLGGTVDVDASVRLEKGSALSSWTVRVRGSVPGWGVESVDFPCIRVTADEESELSVAHGLGRIFRNPAKFEKELLGGAWFGPEMGGAYPSFACCMQMTSLRQGNESLYIAAHDPLGKGKFFHLAPAQDKSSLECSVAHFPEEPMKSPCDWTCSYPTVLGVVEGDWWHCCRVYRKWAVSNAEWMRPPVGKSPKELPDWWVKTALWDHCYYERDVNGERRSLPYILHTQEILGGMPSFVSYAPWTTKGFDVGYPDFFPARDWFVPDAAAALAHGVHYCPYINGIAADPKSDYCRNGGSKYFIKQRPYEAAPTEGLPPMCPQSPWADDIANLAGRVARELKTDMIYFDVVGALQPIPCYTAKHGHPIGNKCDVPVAVRRMMVKARAEAEKYCPKVVFSMEDEVESYGVEAPLLCNRTLSDMDCPMIMAVYADRIDPYGYNATNEEYVNDHMSWRTKLAEEFIYGMKIGAAFPGKPEGKPDIILMLTNLARARMAASKYLSVGQMMHPPVLTGFNPVIKTAWGDYGRKDKVISRPTVRASSWLAEDGTAVLAFTNVSDKPVTLKWRASGQDLGLTALKYGVREIYPSTAAKGYVIEGKALSGNVTVPALGASLLCISPR